MKSQNYGGFDVKIIYTRKETNFIDPKTLKKVMQPYAISIALSKDNTEIARGVAICHDKDQFNKEVGRKKALRRAISEISLSKDERKAIWDDYNNRRSNN